MKSHDYTTFELARLAEVSDPDKHDGIGFVNQDIERCEGSPGAQFLRLIADTVEDDRASYSGEAAEVAHEIADGAVPVYTHSMWKTFVDLTAYTEDVSDYAGDHATMDDQAIAALYIIGCRLAEALIEDEDEDEE